jgi:hypothetical protein
MMCPKAGFPNQPKNDMKKTIVLSLLAALSICAGAKTIDVATAQKAALNFFKVNAGNVTVAPLTATLAHTQTEADNTIDFYVFDISPVHGFVIISASDNVIPVLAYSTETYFKTGFEKVGVSDWVKHASLQINTAIKQNIAPDANITAQWNNYINDLAIPVRRNATGGPLVKSTWNQEPFYNQLCPYNSTDHMRCVTGCVATTMAQIMRYWNYPNQGVGSHSYTDANYGVQSANFGTAIYNWASMPLDVSTLNNDVATLMYHCGVSVEMSYGDDNQGGSGAFVRQAEVGYGGPCAQYAFVNYFSYNPNSIQGVSQSHYNSTAWINLMKGEIDAGRPVQYEGDDQSAGGHTWVCDGYDANNMLHMNWGWGGVDDGYFAVTNLSAGGYNFNNNEAALIGIQPIVGLNVTASSASPSVCLGSGTTLVANGPVSATYSWTPATGLSCTTCASPVATPTATTTYTVTADSGGMTGKFNITITVNPALSVSAANTSVTGVSCNGGHNGSVSLVVDGGTPNYTYHWNTGANTANISNLPAGDYSVTINDAGGCSVVHTETVVQPDAITISVTADNSICTSSSASATASATGGTPGYFYSWSNGTNQADVTGLPSGTYIVTVSDNHGCAATATATVSSTGTATAIQLSTSSTNSTSGNDGTASVDNITGGTPPYTSVLWSNGQSGNQATGLSAGTYTVTVTDNIGCQQTATVTVAGVTGVGNVTGDVVFAIYPNPVHSDMLLHLNEVKQNTWVSIKNCLGQAVLSMQVLNMDTHIDISQLADGIYIAELKQSQNISVKQIVVKK